MKPVAEYDREADAVHVRLSDKPDAFGEDIDRERRIDDAADGTPIGVEIACASTGASLSDLPRREEIDRALRAFDFPIFA